MLARCARCQGTFTTDRFGRQVCPHCGSELDLADPGAPRPPPAEATPPAPPAGPPSPPSGGPGGPPPPSPGWGPPPTSPPPSGWAPPPPVQGWGPIHQGPPPGTPPEPELASPFAERATRGFFPAYFETWKLVATEPQKFFRRVRVDQSGSAVIFGLIAYVFGAVVQGLYSLVSGQQALMGFQRAAEDLPPEAAEFLQQLAASMSGKAALASMLLSPIVGVIGIYLAAGIFHVLLLLFRGAPRGFDATLTVVGYAFGLYLLAAVPACGGLVALVWYVVAVVIGLAEAQRCGSGKALAAVFTPLVLVCVCACVASVAAAGALMKIFQHAAQDGGAPL